MTPTPLRLLLIDDSDADARLVSTELENQGFDLQCKRVMTEKEFREALIDGDYEIILCDFSLPSFGAVEALKIIRESGMDIPLIIVSTALDEAEAVKAMRHGATDYLAKDNLVRLGAAVEREMRDTGMRRQKRAADDVLKENELRYLAQRNALIALTRETQPELLRTEEAFRRITKTTAKTLGVDRVSIWRFTENHENIECLDLYERSRDQHSAGSSLIASDYPDFFEAIKSQELVAADDAANCPSTRELTEKYLLPLGIGAMLDVPIRQEKRVDHLLCCEHVGPARTWTPDEKTFAVAIANLISLSLEIHGRTLARTREQASLLDKARDAIIVRDLNHKITYWNKSAERLYGWTAEEIIGRCGVDLLYLEKSEYLEAHDQTLQTGEWVGQLNQIDKSGKKLIIEGHKSLVTDESGRPQSILAINTDVSEHRMLEQQFIRSQRLESIGILAGGIAHDLNNILTPISMAVELLKMRQLDERGRELLNTIADSTNRGANMVGQVLSFARGDKGCHGRFHPRQIISEIESIVRDTFPKNIELEVNADRDLWSIEGDLTQVHQVILNFCVNASDAIKGPGKISINAKNVHLSASFAAVNLEAKEGPYVCIGVQDSGEGIPAEVIDRIFDPFFTTKDIGKGSGLGLPTSLAQVSF